VTRKKQKKRTTKKPSLVLISNSLNSIIIIYYLFKMGCIATKQFESEDVVNRKIEDNLIKDKKKQSSVYKLLLIGPGESGKSTIFSQIKIISAGFSDNEKKNMSRIVRINLLHAIQSLIKGLQKLEIPLEHPENESRFEKVITFKEPNNISEIKDDIIALWADKGIQRAFANSNKFQLIDQAKYFLDSIEHLCDPNFIPTENDIIRSRAKTSAIVEMEIPLESASLRIIDVGGQRSERKKWIHCFEGVTAVIYVTSLSEYDQTLFEDNKTNRMEESLKLFAEICNSTWFKNSHMILFFNKMDIFKEKIQREDPKNYCFPDYTGGKNEKAALAYIKQQFLDKNSDPARTIYTKETCAIDKENINFVFSSIKNSILQKSLETLFSL